MELLNQILGGGWASVIAAAGGALLAHYGKQFVSKPDAPKVGGLDLGGLVNLIHPDSKSFPILAWFAQLPQEQRDAFFKAVQERLTK